MNFEKIEQAYDLLLENVQTIQNLLGTNIYDALIEQNAAYLAGEHDNSVVAKNNQSLNNLQLTKEEWRRAYQFLFIKANQTEPMQYNHQFTPDSIGFIMTFLLDQLVTGDKITVLEIGSGTGNLAQTLLNHSQKELDYLGIEIDDLLIDLSASIADVMQAEISFAQGDAVRPQILKKSQVIIADLPIGYYPDDAVASRYQMASQLEHTYAHHLLIEQSLKYLEQDGYAILLAPNDLLTSPQSNLLKPWLKEHASIVGMITLPTTLFGQQTMAKSIFILQKKTENPITAFIYPLQSVQEAEIVHDFMDNFKKWKKENAI
ncbi:TPA: class I SAM-dependent methyltransferase [Streptococcus suis]